eukprot:CAMPEP_0194547532 /NCGR_PEP_ID=MMETSP0253-20130528/92289_1 /TAXON_ID=2966 /ORGANISM="Noctiluca scintillans" /LENGTH=85 /DNA_ID=CAMNT_0039394747 /DNA_START=311 /DNA_END=564 /DNA_ORIENTATION=+
MLRFLLRLHFSSGEVLWNATFPRHARGFRCALRSSFLARLQPALVRVTRGLWLGPSILKFLMQLLQWGDTTSRVLACHTQPPGKT